MCRPLLSGGPQKVSAQTRGARHARNLVLSILTFSFQRSPEQCFLMAWRCRASIPSQLLPGLSSCICVLRGRRDSGVLLRRSLGNLLCWSQGLLQQLAVGIKGINPGPRVFQPPEALPDFWVLELAALAGSFPKAKRGSSSPSLGGVTWGEAVPWGGQPRTSAHPTPRPHHPSLSFGMWSEEL